VPTVNWRPWPDLKDAIYRHAHHIGRQACPSGNSTIGLYHCVESQLVRAVLDLVRFEGHFSICARIAQSYRLRTECNTLDPRAFRFKLHVRLDQYTAVDIGKSPLKNTFVSICILKMDLQPCLVRLLWPIDGALARPVCYSVQASSER
jgi:hypothetical protein